MKRFILFVMVLFASGISHAMKHEAEPVKAEPKRESTKPETKPSTTTQEHGTPQITPKTPREQIEAFKNHQPTKEQLVQLAQHILEQRESQVTRVDLMPDDYQLIANKLYELPVTDRTKAFEKWYSIFQEYTPTRFDAFKKEYIDALKKSKDKDDLLRGLALLDPDFLSALQLQPSALKDPLELLDEVTKVAWNHQQEGKTEYQDIYRNLLGSILLDLSKLPRAEFIQLFSNVQQANRLHHIIMLLFENNLTSPIKSNTSLENYTPSDSLFKSLINDFCTRLVNELNSSAVQNQGPLAEAVVKMLIAFPTQNYKKEGNPWLNSLVSSVNLSKIPNDTMPRDLILFFRNIGDEKRTAEAFAKYAESVSATANSLEAMKPALTLLKLFKDSKNFVKQNSKAMNSVMKKYAELLKADGTFADYIFAIKTLEEYLTPFTLIELQIDLLKKLEEPKNNWLSKLSESDVDFLSSMMKQMTDQQIPKSATALYNLIKTVKATIDDKNTSTTQKENLQKLANKLADDIVPNMEWTQRWSGTISSFFDTYLPWWGKSRTYKPNWSKWPWEKRMKTLYGLDQDDLEYQIRNYFGVEELPRFKDTHIRYPSGSPKAAACLDKLLDIWDYYQPNDRRFESIYATLRNDARIIFEATWTYNGVYALVHSNSRRRDFLFSMPDDDKPLVINNWDPNGPDKEASLRLKLKFVFFPTDI